MGSSSSPSPSEFVPLPFLSLDRSRRGAVPPAAVAQELLHARDPAGAQGSSPSEAGPSTRRGSRGLLPSRLSSLALQCSGAVGLTWPVSIILQEVKNYM